MGTDDNQSISVAERNRVIVKTSIIGIGTNLLLSATKAVIGLASNSIAILLDAVNNLSDAFSSVVTIIGAKLAGKKPDKSTLWIWTGGISERKPHRRRHSVCRHHLAGRVCAENHTSRDGRLLYTVAADCGRSCSNKAVTGSLRETHWQESEQRLTGRLGHRGAVRCGGIIISLAQRHSIYRVACECRGLSGCNYRGAHHPHQHTHAEEHRQQHIGPAHRQQAHQRHQSLRLPTIWSERSLRPFAARLWSRPSDWVTAHRGADTATAAEIDQLTRLIQDGVYAEFHVTLATIGIYSVNTHDTVAADIRAKVTQMVTCRQYVMQIHGFHADTERKKISLRHCGRLCRPQSQSSFEAAIADIQQTFPTTKSRQTWMPTSAIEHL